jgi:hypothetical protein
MHSQLQQANTEHTHSHTTTYIRRCAPYFRIERTYMHMHMHMHSSGRMYQMSYDEAAGLAV